jgi:hypothetical protein
MPSTIAADVRGALKTALAPLQLLIFTTQFPSRPSFQR